MNIRRDLVKENGKILQYIYIDLEEEYEFGQDFFKKDDKNSFVYKLKEFVKSIINNVSDDSAVLIINGIMVGTLSLSAFLGTFNKKMSQDTLKIMSENVENSQVLNEYNFKDSLLKKSQKKNTDELLNDDIAQLDIAESTGIDINEESEILQLKDINNEKTNEVNDITNDNISYKTDDTKDENIIENNENVTSNESSENVLNEDYYESEVANQPEYNQITVMLNLNGNVINIELEEYVTGVVAAEMPASFNMEALKAQAVAARTYAMKKTAAGRVLSASVSDQAYNTMDQMRNKWGNSFDFYYAKVKEAVYDTKGTVMMYEGNYIDALYHAISSGTTEMPKYIWNSSYPYLVSVDSSLDKNVRSYEVTNNYDYNSVTSKLGVNVDINTEIEVLSYTESGRVNEIKIGEKVFSGVNVRAKLGLRSTDFNISKTDSALVITTRGYGHGVGMSQYGANEYAKIGMSYIDILNHYYTGIYFASV